MTPNTVQPITDELLADIEEYLSLSARHLDDEQAAVTKHELRSLIARLRAAEKDQARYLWLREQGESFQWYNITRVDPDDFASLDDCIDAAMHQG